DPYPVEDNFLPQLGTTNKINAGDARMGNVLYRNGTLWCAQTIFTPTNAPTYSSIQWWELTPGGFPNQQGFIAHPFGGYFYAYPSIAVNQWNDLVVGYTRFASSEYPSANYSFRSEQDPLESQRDDAVLKAGEAPYVAIDSRQINNWGNWSGAAV